MKYLIILTFFFCLFCFWNYVLHFIKKHEVRVMKYERKIGLAIGKALLWPLLFGCILFVVLAKAIKWIFDLLAHALPVLFQLWLVHFIFKSWHPSSSELPKK